MVHVHRINLFIHKLFMKIVLGSASPRRQELMKQLGFDFRVLTADCAEDFQIQNGPEEIVIDIAKQKADSLISQIDPDELLICADTIVFLDGEVIGKPKDVQNAFELLAKLSGRTHEVHTGIVLTSSMKTHTFSVKTSVQFRHITKEEIDYYIQREKPFDKAGSYGIQDWIGLIAVEKIIGSYTNVMGLPTQEIYAAIRAF